MRQSLGGIHLDCNHDERQCVYTPVYATFVKPMNRMRFQFYLLVSQIQNSGVKIVHFKLHDVRRISFSSNDEDIAKLLDVLLPLSAISVPISP